MDTKAPIVFYDSGVGGLPYLAHARQFLPAERFVYLQIVPAFPMAKKGKKKLFNWLCVLSGQ
jgi:glutamate racemase